MKNISLFWCFKVVFLFSSVMSFRSYASCQISGKDSLTILILGNSITFHSIDTSIGWYGNWGMAASSMDSDYIHLLQKQLLLAKGPLVNLKYFNVAQKFEREIGHFNDNKFDDLKNIHPDILVLRLGENIGNDSAILSNIGSDLRLIVELVRGGNENMKVLITTTFWRIKNIDNQIIKAANVEKWDLIDFSDIINDTNSMATGKFLNQGIARHPSDHGMKMINDRIWKCLVKYIK